MPRKPVKPIGPWERLTPEALEPLPKNSRKWALRREEESEQGPWAKPRDWETWDHLPPEYQTALVWAYLYAGPSSWIEREKLEYLVKKRPVSLLKIVSIENRKWMINALKKLWPTLLDVHLEKGIAIFFQMNWESIKREFVDHKNLLSAVPTFKDENMESLLGPYWKEILDEGFRISLPQPTLDISHYYNWLMSEAEETQNNGFDLAGLVLPIPPVQFIQKRLLPTPHGIRAGFLCYSSDFDTHIQLSDMLKKLNHCCKTQIGDVPASITKDDRLGIGGQLHPLKDLQILAQKAIRSIMHHDVRCVPSLNLIGKALSIEEYKTLFPDDF